MAVLMGGLTLVDMEADTDAAGQYLNLVSSVATTNIGGTTYLYAASKNDSAIEIYRIGANGELISAGELQLNLTGLPLSSPTDISVVTVGANKYLAVSGAFNTVGVATYQINLSPGASEGSLTVVDREAAVGIIGTNQVAATVGNNAFIVSISNGRLVSMQIGTNGQITQRDTETELATPAAPLTFGHSIATFTRDGVTYIVTGSYNESFLGESEGLGLWRLNGDGSLELQDSEPTLDPVHGFNSIDTAVIGGRQFIFAVNATLSSSTGSITTYEMTAAGTLTFVSNNLVSMSSTQTLSHFVVEGQTFLTLSDFGEPGLAIYGVDGNGTINFSSAQGNLPGSLTQSLTHGVVVIGDRVFGLSSGGNPFGSGSQGLNSFDLGGGNDLINGTSNADQIYGLLGDDTINGGGGAEAGYGGDGKDSLSGEAGNDTLSGGTGDDKLYGGTEDDVLHGDGGKDTVEGGAGQDTLQGDGADDVLDGQDGNDSLLGDTGNDTLAGGSGNDALDGGDGADSLNGNEDNDTLTGGIGNDSLFGDAQNDSLIGGTGSDLLNGGTGNDTLTGGDDADTLTGDVGRDRLFGDGGADSLVGGSEVDTLLGGNGNDTLDGGTGADSLQGDANDDILSGGTGKDVLKGGTGNDTLYGVDATNQTGVANEGDTLAGGAGADLLSGTTLGFDYADYRSFAGGVTVDLSTGTGIGGDAQGDLLVNINGLYGSRGNDSLTGDATDNRIYGELGVDIIHGGAGNDAIFGGPAPTLPPNLALDGNNTLFGDAGSDTITGDMLNDLLDGGDGADLLIGSSGNDTMIGGDGGDTFRFRFGETGDDRIIDDFGTLIRDRIDLTDFTAFHTLADIKAAAVNNGGSVVITLAQDHTLTIEGMRESDLFARMFIFDPL